MNAGVAGLAAGLGGILSGLALLDAWFALRGERPVGARLNAAAGRYPLYSLALTGFLGALLAHLFLQS